MFVLIAMIYKKILHGDRIILRPLKIYDAVDRVKWRKDEEMTQFLPSGKRTLEEEKNKIRKKLKDSDCYYFSIETIEGKHIGGCSLLHIVKGVKKAELSVMIGDKKYWNRGYGTDVIKLILKFGFKVLKLNKIHLKCIEYNKRGIRCYEKCGFKHEGRLRKHMFKKGKAWDEIRMSILINEYTKKYDKRK